jgi:hypothetical protein
LDIRCHRLQHLVSGWSCSWTRESWGGQFMTRLLSICHDLRFLRLEDCHFLGIIPVSVVELIVDVHDGQFRTVALSVPPNLKRLTFVVKRVTQSPPGLLRGVILQIARSCPYLVHLGINVDIPDLQPKDDGWYEKELSKLDRELPPEWRRVSELERQLPRKWLPLAVSRSEINLAVVRSGELQIAVKADNGNESDDLTH